MSQGPPLQGRPESEVRCRHPCKHSGKGLVGCCRAGWLLSVSGVGQGQEHGAIAPVQVLGMPGTQHSAAHPACLPQLLGQSLCLAHSSKRGTQRSTPSSMQPSSPTQLSCAPHIGVLASSPRPLLCSCVSLSRMRLYASWLSDRHATWVARAAAAAGGNQLLQLAYQACSRRATARRMLCWRQSMLYSTRLRQ